MNCVIISDRSYVQHRHKCTDTGCMPQLMSDFKVLLLNHHVKEGRPCLHDGTVTMSSGQEPIPLCNRLLLANQPE